MLIILAGITLNAVIGEDGIIFQAKDTKNMISNETQYDNEQLAQLQNELKDNELYSGIGIIPGIDAGGGSEGGEQGGGQNQGGTGTNAGGTGGSNNTQTGTPIDPDKKNNTTGEIIEGENAQDPTIRVLDGEEIAASFYRSDVTVQIYTQDKSQRIKYILTTTVKEINDELYPSGLVKELDIENGGTLTLTKDGEYTLTAYAYDVYGNKSNATVMWIKRETGTTPGNGVTVSVSSGNMGQNNWYSSNVTIRVLGTDTGSTRVTYRVAGTAYSKGIIGNLEFDRGPLDTQEVEIANGTTFKLELDGEFAIVAYTYDSGGMRLSTATTLNIKRDASRPIVTLYKGEQVLGQGFQISMAAVDMASDLATQERYTYRHKQAPDMTYTDIKSLNTTLMYTGLEQDKTYDMYVVVKDEAGNMTASDVISKPALWISNTPTVGEKGTEGARTYYSTDVDVSLTGQDRNNVDISKVTYQILGTTTGAGVMDNINYDKGVALPENEYEIDNNNSKTIQIRVDGNWVIKVHTYNKEGIKVTTNTYEVTRDTVTPEPPVIEVASGTMGDETYYRSDIDVRVTGQDDTCFKKVTYTVTGTATGAGSIGGVTIASGQAVNITETDITNGGTFKIQADGRWTIKGYTYDKAGRKSVVATGIVVTRDMVNPTANTPQITSGTVGEPSYYRSDVIVKIFGSDTTSFKKMTYRITGTAKGTNGKGTVGNTTVTENQVLDTGEVEIANNGTFTVQADGTWTVMAYSYDKAGRKSAVTTSLVFTRDTVNPTVTSFSRSLLSLTGFRGLVSATDGEGGSGIGTYSYYLNGTNSGTTTNNYFDYSFTRVRVATNYLAKVEVRDKAGNKAEAQFNVNYTSVTKFGYTGDSQTYNMSAGSYLFEVWGAQGGGSTYDTANYGYLYGGRGGYSSGEFNLNAASTAYVYVGGAGVTLTTTDPGSGTKGRIQWGRKWLTFRTGWWRRI